MTTPTHRITSVLAAQLGPEHLGHQIAFYNDRGQRVHGQLTGIDTIPRARLLLLAPDRAVTIGANTEVDVIEQEET